jgi:glycosyltransferase involved in cell wall biosynthesis
MIHILFIHGITAIGGAEKDLLMILEGLDKSRFYPVVVLPDCGPLAKKIQKLGIKCHFSSLPPWRKFKYFPFIFPSLIHLYYLVIKEKTDLIHVNDMWWIPLGYIVSRMAKIPTVAFLRAELEFRRIRQYWLTRPTLLIPVSNSIKNTLLENNMDPERIQTIYHGVNCEGTLAVEQNPKSGSSPYSPIIGTIANIFPWKGLEYLIQAVDHLKPNYPDIRCLIVGKGDKNYQYKLDLLVKNLNLEDNIEFLGFQEDVNSVLSRFEIFVLPSIREGFGIVLLEAMAMKKAVVASRVGGIPEIVQDGRTGLLVPPGNSIAIADAIHRLIENESLRHQFEKAGYDRICQDFSRQKMIEEISTVYTRLAHQPSDRIKVPNILFKPKISALIITLNEEKNIKDCLDHLDWVDEIIVVDAESQDKTEEICSKYPVKWFKRPWPGFGPQKNFGIEQAKGDWILIVDADERVTPELRNEILSEIQNDHPYAGYEIPRKNFFYGKWIRYGGAYPDYQLRLFKRNVGHYDQTPVHEHFILQGSAGYLTSPMDHFTERQIFDHFKKFDQYTSLAAKHELERSRSSHWSQCLINPVLTFLKIYIIKKGFLNGVHGLIYSCFVAMYTFVKYAKLWELKEK